MTGPPSTTTTTTEDTMTTTTTTRAALEAQLPSEAALRESVRLLRQAATGNTPPRAAHRRAQRTFAAYERITRQLRALEDGAQ